MFQQSTGKLTPPRLPSHPPPPQRSISHSEVSRVPRYQPDSNNAQHYSCQNGCKSGSEIKMAAKTQGYDTQLGGPAQRIEHFQDWIIFANNPWNFLFVKFVCIRCKATHIFRILLHFQATKINRLTFSNISQLYQTASFWNNLYICQKWYFV